MAKEREMSNTLNAESDRNLGCSTAVQCCFLWQQQGSQNLRVQLWHSHPAEAHTAFSSGQELFSWY